MTTALLPTLISKNKKVFISKIAKNSMQCKLHLKMDKYLLSNEIFHDCQSTATARDQHVMALLLY